jgi:tetratricopeptide (TPR) repeat protein
MHRQFFFIFVIRIRYLVIFFLLLACLPCQVHSQESIPELYYSGQYNQVINTATEATVQGDTSLSLYYFKALSETQLGLTGQAIETLEKGLMQHGEETGLHRMLGGVYFNAGDYTRAGSQFRYLLEKDSLDVSSWLKLAEIASFRQQYEEAIDALGRILYIDSLNLEGMMMTGDILNRHNNSGAVIYYERALRNYPRNQKAALALANSYLQEQRPEDAIQVCRQMLSIDSTSIRFTKLLGYACYKAGHHQSAAHYLDYATVLGDSSVFCFKYLGISRYLNVDMQQAVRALRIALEKDSLDAEVHFFLGVSLANTGEKDSAMWHMNRSLELMEPDTILVSGIYSEQGNLKRLEESYQEAYELYRKAWDANNENLMALYFMASIQDNSLHDLDRALEDYRFFIEQLDRQPSAAVKNDQIPTVRDIVEDRIVTLKEELFFQDR